MSNVAGHGPSAESVDATTAMAAAGPAFQANDRLKVGQPSREFLLAEENEIPIHIAAAGLRSLLLEQAQAIQYRPVKLDRPVVVEDGYADLKVLRAENGAQYVKVKPVRLGKVVLKFTALFSDGGYATAEVQAHVVPSKQPPDKIIVGVLGSPSQNVGSFDVPLNPTYDREGLTLTASYAGLDHPVHIDPSFATFEVRTDGGTLIIDLDRTTGGIKPLRVGQALVVTRYGDRTNFTCVRVVERLDPNRKGPESQCEPLLRAGEKLGSRP